MISELIKLLMKECGLDQRQLGEVMGVKLQRVKNLSAGFVQKLTREESESLVKKLHVRAEWLVTGEGPMFQTAGEQEFKRRLDTVAQASRVAVSAGLTPSQADVLQRVLMAAQTGDAVTLEKMLISLRPDESALLDGYRLATHDVQDAVLRALAAGPRKRIPMPGHIEIVEPGKKSVAVAKKKGAAA